jgi:hypothetical protein
MLGVSYGHRFTMGHLDRRIEGWSVDYTSQLGSYLQLAHSISDRLALIGSLDDAMVTPETAKPK